MPTTKADPARVERARVVVFVVAGLVVILAVVLVLSWRSPPQMGADEDVFNTVDALFTAVTARDEKRLTECERRLKAHRDAGKLPPDAAETLDGIIAKAKNGSWETAAERLYDFMRVQRREGASEPK